MYILKSGKFQITCTLQDGRCFGFPHGRQSAGKRWNARKCWAHDKARGPFLVVATRFLILLDFFSLLLLLFRCFDSNPKQFAVYIYKYASVYNLCKSLLYCMCILPMADFFFLCAVLRAA
jgi:hypothetical protein